MGKDELRFVEDRDRVLDDEIAAFRRKPSGERLPEAKRLAIDWAWAVVDKQILEWPAKEIWKVLVGRLAQNGAEALQLTVEVGAAMLELIEGVKFLRKLQIQGATVARPQRAHREADPIELYSGELVHEADDLVVRGAGIDFVFHRTYRSRADFEGALGARWDHGYHVTLWIEGEVARVWTGSLVAEIYRRHPRWGEPGFTYYVPPDGVDATVEPVGDPDDPQAWSRRAPDGVRHVFEVTETWGPGRFRLGRIEDRFGNALRFSYDQDRIVVCEVNHPARWVRFGYDDRNRIVRVADHTGRTWQYRYDDLGDLVAVIAPATPSQPSPPPTYFEYSTARRTGVLAHQLERVTDAAGHLYLENEYGTAGVELGRVIRQRLGGGVSMYSYEPVDGPGDVALAIEDRPAMGVRVVERHGRETLHVYNALGGLLRKSECRLGPHGHEHVVWRYRYDRDGVLVAARSPDGVVTQTLTGRAVFVRTHFAADDDTLGIHEHLSAEQRRGFSRMVATIRRATRHLDELGLGWDARFGDPWSGSPQDVIVKRGFEPRYGQLLYESDPRATITPDPGGVEAPDHDRYRTRFEYTGPPDDPSQRLHRVQFPTATLPDGTTADVIAETIDEVDARGRVLRRTDRRGIVTTFTYATADEGARAGFLTRVVVDPAGLASTTELEIDELGRTVAVTPPRGVGRVRTTYDALDRLIEVVRPDGSTTRTSYEPSGQVASVERDWRSPDGALDPRGPVVEHFAWNEEHLLCAEARGGPDPETQRITRHRYGPSGERIVTTLPAGNRVAYRYDERLLLVETTRGAGSADASSTRCEYDRDGRAVATTSGEGNTIRETFDALGRVVARVDPLGNVDRHDHDKAGRIVLSRRFERTPDGRFQLLARHATAYDELGRPCRTTADRFEAPEPVPPGVPLEEAFRDGGPGSPVSRQIFHDAADQVVAIIDEVGAATRFEFDALGRPHRVIDAVGNAVVDTLDAHGNITRRDHVDLIQDEDGQVIGTEVLSWTAEYDELDRLIAATDAMGNRTQFVYDSLDRCVRAIDPLGHVTETEFDVHGHAVAVISPRTDASDVPLPPAIVRTEHDANGNAIAVIDARGRRTEVRFDSLDRPVERIFPDGTSARTWFDRDDRAVRRRDPRGLVTRTRYDAAGRPLRVEADVSELDAGVIIDGPLTVEYAYDGLGRIAAASNTVARLEIAYDSLGHSRVERTRIGDQSFTLQRTFDDRGALTRLVYPGGRAIGYERDPIGRLVRVVEESQGVGYPGAAAASARPLALFAHVAARPRLVTRPNSSRTELRSDAAGRTVEIAHSMPSGDLLRSQYLPDANGNPRAFVEVGPSSSCQRFACDAQGQLVRATAASVPDFDPGEFGPPSIPGAVVPQQALLDAVAVNASGPTTTWVYDAVGARERVETDGAPTVYATNLVDEYVAIDGVSRTYDRAGNVVDDGAREHQFDIAGRLARVVDRATDTVLLRRAYDPVGRPILEEFAGRPSMICLHDGPDRIADFIEGEVVAQYVHAELGEAPIHLATAGVDAWYHVDAIGSVRALTGSDGGLLAVYRYDAFGSVVAQDGPELSSGGLGQPFGFGGRPVLASLGLHDHRARVYVPATGSFLQRDPLGPFDGTNLYVYAGNNPLAFSDPSGFAREEIDHPRRRRRRRGSVEDGGVVYTVAVGRYGIPLSAMERAEEDSAPTWVDFALSAFAGVAESVGSPNPFSDLFREVGLGISDFVVDTLKWGKHKIDLRVKYGLIEGSKRDLQETVEGIVDSVTSAIDDPEGFLKRNLHPRALTRNIVGAFVFEAAPGLVRGAGRGRPRYFAHGGKRARVQSLVAEGVQPNAAWEFPPHPRGSFFTHETVSTFDDLGFASATEWARVRGGRAGGQVAVLRLPRWVVARIEQRGHVTTGPTPGLPFFAPQTVFHPKAFKLLNKHAKWRTFEVP